jgi:hypothetical protein
MSDFEPIKSKTKAKPETETKLTAAPKEVEGQSSPEPQKPEKKYDTDELLKIFDELLFTGVYTEKVSIKGRLNVEFRTRTAEEMAAITREIDGTSAVLMATVMEKRNLLNLYHGLVSYQGKDLSTAKYEDKVSFINKLPAPVVGLLMVSLYDFDMKVEAATKEAEENF